MCDCKITYRLHLDGKRLTDLSMEEIDALEQEAMNNGMVKIAGHYAHPVLEAMRAAMIEYRSI